MPNLPVEMPTTANVLRDLLLYPKNRRESRTTPAAMPAIPAFGKLKLFEPTVGKFKPDPEPVAGVNVVDDVPSNTTESIHNV